MPATLAIDFGEKYLGIALVEHAADMPNRVRYAATLVVEPKPLKSAVQPRATCRRMRRTRKTHQRRLRRLAAALAGIEGAAPIVRFCRRRGYSHEPEDTDETARAFHVPRDAFFAALEMEIARVIAPADRRRVLDACRRHLNAGRRREAELRPARFENRGPSKCHWEGCHRNVPRAANAVAERLRQCLFAWLKPVFDAAEDGHRQKLRKSVEHWIGELDGLAKAYRAAERLEQSAAKAAAKALDTRKNRIYKNLRERIIAEAPDGPGTEFAEHWTETYRRNVTDIVKGRQGGRVAYCREHSIAFVDYFLAGRQIPNRIDVAEADLFGRRQQILFRRLWRLVEARLLPLAGGRIDRVIVERAAFDVLAGKFKDRREVSEDRAAEMYWRGPRFGFADRREMLKAEFAGRCAYCGQQNAMLETDHILPQNQFPFDSYFNVLPACSACNAQKGGRTALAAGLRVHPEAFEAFSDYVARRKPPHYFHTVKKGLLKLWTRDGHVPEVEKQLGLLAENLVSIASTQKGQRPLARYLAGRLEQKTGQRPEIGYTAGRHTAIYRSIVLPEFDKEESKTERPLINHAVDAVMLACRLPSAPAAENRRWYMRAKDLNEWENKVRAAAPALADGLPRVERVVPVPHFEIDMGGGYFQLELSAFNWNAGRQSGHLLDPVGVTPRGKTIKREPAANVLAKLMQGEVERAKQIARISQPALRALLQHATSAPEAFVAWLQQTTKAGLLMKKMRNHPADQARMRLLEEFVNSPVEEFVGGDKEHRRDIPRTIGIRCLVSDSSTKFDVTRADRQGRVFQRYMTDPHWRMIFVCYREHSGQVDRARPLLLCVNQIWAITRREGPREGPLDVEAGSPLLGRPLGSAGPLKDFLANWQAAIDELCRREGVVKRFKVTQGAVIEKMDGSYFQLRNFDKSRPWMRGAPFKNIRRVHRSPLKFLSSDGAESSLSRLAEGDETAGD